MQYDDIEYYTTTYIIVTNTEIALDSLYNYLPITEYRPPKKRRGRRRKEPAEPVERVPPVGSIISVQYGTRHKGVLMKKKIGSSRNMLNCVSVYMIINEEGKSVNCKAFSNGKFHVTGCRLSDDSRAERYQQIDTFVRMFYRAIRESEHAAQSNIMSFRVDPRTNVLYDEFVCICRIHMKNKSFKLDFRVNRQKLDQLINRCRDSDMFSFFDEQVRSVGVIIKFAVKDPYDAHLKKITIAGRDAGYADTTEFTTADEYFALMSPEEHQKDVRKTENRFHTFMVFSTGSVVQSGCGSEMKRVFDTLNCLFEENKDEFREICYG